MTKTYKIVSYYDYEPEESYGYTDSLEVAEQIKDFIEDQLGLTEGVEIEQIVRFESLEDFKHKAWD